MGASLINMLSIKPCITNLKGLVGTLVKLSMGRSVVYATMAEGAFLAYLKASNLPDIIL